MIIASNSHTFPSINIDFSNFFQLIGDIKLWHYQFIKKQETNIYISITFFELYKQEKFEIYEEVRQVNLFQFKSLYGNILQSHSDYLELQIVGFQLLNCPQELVEQLNFIQLARNAMVLQKLIVYSVLNHQIENTSQILRSAFVNMELLIWITNVQLMKVQIQLLQVQTKSICKVVSMDISNLTMLVFEVHLQIWIMLSHVLSVYRIQGMDEYALLTSLYSHDDGNISQYIYETDLCYKFVGNDINYYLCEDECLYCQFFEQFNSNIQQITII
ncbi:unnamed protein product [Paramecium pentaurelia]|uniref:Uncharacterized protein n=1 Tax=Paramecium pentaurelia TaxID=43138 RepID=A0A8S1Y2Y6_9CILI|nr:unnamed protein product [Paramecium pentaurelia]